MVKILLYILLALVVLLIGLFLLGPRMPLDRTVRDWSPAPSDGLDDQLAAEENAVGDVWDYARKEIVWAGEPGAKTDLAVVYIHGWQATKAETRPLPDELAAALGANLYFTRMTGHGQGVKPTEDPERAGEALAEATFNDWYNDLSQAMAVGRQLGDRVVLMGTSNGGGMILSALEDETVMADVALIALVSPLVTVADPVNQVFARFPFTKQLAGIVQGDEHNWTDQAANDDHRKYWTTRSPIGSVVPITAVVRAVDQVDLSAADLPLVVAYGPNDRIVSAPHTQRLIENWRGPVESLAVTDTSDRDNHVIAGAIMSPNKTAEVSAWMIAAVRELLN